MLWPVGLVLGLVLFSFIHSEAGCNRKYHPGKTAISRAKRDYPKCDRIKVLSETKIRYQKSRRRKSRVVLSICGEKTEYRCKTYQQLRESYEVAGVSYECYEVKVDLSEVLKKGPREASGRKPVTLTAASKIRSFMLAFGPKAKYEVAVGST